ncbi:metal ABC transporter solute-binding protein, Zn/Mn family [Dongia soli]|uniref:Zinc ABC transporter substrate-binding protein n=1 Tax=Dongia soli TaxID=600628 RepID=A0ABU5E8B3_9PROT|nr:zinc ABC transporter substrate-binding protein [Dongia soli]MDY0882553.1 zinc ABC transporter substrate-binding protein [Dongia soli]
MQPVRPVLLAALTLALSLTASMPTTFAADGKRLSIVAAENFYGDVAEQLGGPDVRVTSILSNPDQDPHMFEASPAAARALADAALVIYNGADYDPWVQKLLEAAETPSARIIVAADLTRTQSGDNPHLWYDPNTISALAKALSSALITADPAHEADYKKRLQDFLASLQPLRDRIQHLHDRYAGVPVTATEPVFAYMAQAIGLEDRNQRFQRSIMNDTEPSAKDIAAFQDDLKSRRVKALIYNSQTTDDLTSRLLDLAKASGIPIVGVSETEPADKTYQEWMLDQLTALEKALSPVPAGVTTTTQ